MVTFDADFADVDSGVGCATTAAAPSHPARATRGEFVLGYAASTPTEISDGVATLGNVLRRLF